MQNKSAVLIEDLSTWVYTDIKNYPRLEDIKAHMEKLYPTTYDKHRKCWVQHYRINSIRNGTHRVFAARKLSKDDVEHLEDANNV